jgi:hypothetical protein
MSLDMLQIYTEPQLMHLWSVVIIQQDSTLLHWATMVWDFQHEMFPVRSIDHDSPVGLLGLCTSDAQLTANWQKQMIHDK